MVEDIQKTQAPLLKVGRYDTPQLLNAQTQGKPVDTSTADEFVFNPEIGLDKPADIKGDDKKDKNADASAQEAKFNYSRFKDFVGKEEFGEDDLENAFKERDTKLKETNGKLSILKEGKERLKADKQYNDWKNFAGQKDEDLVTANLAYDYAEEGTPANEALKKAKERVEEEVKRNPHYTEDTARAIRRGLNQSIQEREQTIQTEIENAGKDINFVSPSAELETKVKENWSKTEDFLGMKFPEAERTKMLSKAYKSPQQLNELLKDPAFYNEVCLLSEYKKQFKANIENRTNGKSKVLDKLPKTPSVGSGIRTISSSDGSSPKKFDGKGFLGR